MTTLNLRELGVRGVNAALYAVAKDSNDRHWVVEEPMGQHAIACGLDAPLNVEIDGHAGFYCGGMNKEAEITIKGHAGVGVGENMMSGRIHVTGNASESAGATAHGGLLVIEGDAFSTRTNIAGFVTGVLSDLLALLRKFPVFFFQLVFDQKAFSKKVLLAGVAVFSYILI